VRQGRRKCWLSMGLGTPRAPACISPSPQMPSPGLRLGDRLQPPIALGFVSSTPPAKIGTICSAGARRARGEPWEGAAGQPGSDPPCFALGSQAEKRCKRAVRRGGAAWGSALVSAGGRSCLRAFSKAPNNLMVEMGRGNQMGDIRPCPGRNPYCHIQRLFWCFRRKSNSRERNKAAGEDTQLPLPRVAAKHNGKSFEAWRQGSQPQPVSAPPLPVFQAWHRDAGGEARSPMPSPATSLQFSQANCLS